MHKPLDLRAAFSLSHRRIIRSTHILRSPVLVRVLRDLDAEGRIPYLRKLYQTPGRTASPRKLAGRNGRKIDGVYAGK
jgi:hypothetical protein